MARLNTVKSFRGTSKTEDGNLRCGKCGGVITKGDGYRWWANRAPGRRIRCMRSECTPRPSEKEGNPKRSMLMAAAEDAGDQLQAVSIDGETTADDLEEAVRGVVDGAGEAVQGVADEMREGAESIRAGFGHDTYASEELDGRAEEMESQAQGLTGWYPSADQPVEGDEEDEDDPQEALREYLDALVEEATEVIDANTELV